MIVGKSVSGWIHDYHWFRALDKVRLGRRRVLKLVQEEWRIRIR